MYKAIFLDIDNTLLSFTAAAQESMRTAMAAAGKCYTPEIWPLFRRINDALWRRLEAGGLTPQQLYDTRWNIIFAELGWQLDGAAFEKMFQAGLNESAVPETDALPLLAALDALRPGSLLCAASNGPYEQQRHRLELAGMLRYFDRLFISEAIGFSKPDPRFFETCFTQLDGIQPAECLMIGDSLTADIAGAAGCGMHTCWYNAENRPSPAEPLPDFTVTALSQIPSLL